MHNCLTELSLMIFNTNNGVVNYCFVIYLLYVPIYRLTFLKDLQFVCLTKHFTLQTLPIRFINIILICTICLQIGKTNSFWTQESIMLLRRLCDLINLCAKTHFDDDVPNCEFKAKVYFCIGFNRSPQSNQVNYFSLISVGNFS